MIDDPDIDALWICAPELHPRRGHGGDRPRRRQGQGRASSASPARSPSAATSAKPEGCSSSPAKAGAPRRLSREPGLLPRRRPGQGDRLGPRRGPLPARPTSPGRPRSTAGPHMPWFWEGTLQGGGVLNDMMCHSVEEARFMLTPPGAPRDVLTPVKRHRLRQLPEMAGAQVRRRSWPKTQRRQDRLHQPAVRGLRPLARRIQGREGQDPRRRDDDLLVLCRRRAAPEHGAPRPRILPRRSTPSTPGSRSSSAANVRGKAGEDLVEKQNAEIGLMPVVADEAGRIRLHRREPAHGPVLPRRRRGPEENFDDGLAVTELLMAAYMSAEKEQDHPLPRPRASDDFIPAVARGAWNPKSK